MNEEPKKRSWRRWRISIRTLLILVTLISVFLGLYVAKSIQQQRLVQSLHKDGVGVEYYYKYSSNEALVSPPKNWAPQWFVEMVGIDFFSRVHSVYVGAESFDDLSKLKKLDDIKFVQVGHGAVNDLSPLRKLNKLCCIDLEGFTGDLAPVAEIESLTSLALSGRYFTDPDSQKISGNPSNKLEVRHVTYDLAPLARSKSLKELVMYFLVERTDLNPLSEIENLETLSIYSQKISDISGLSQCKSLKKLYLNFPANADLSPLFGLDQLKELTFGSYDLINKEDVRELQEHLPNCVIEGWQ